MKSNEVRFGCCILACDMEAMVHFYRDTLGLKPSGTAVISQNFIRQVGRYRFGFITERRSLRRSTRIAHFPAVSIRPLK